MVRCLLFSLFCAHRLWAICNELLGGVEGPKWCGKKFPKFGIRFVLRQTIATMWDNFS